MHVNSEQDVFEHIVHILRNFEGQEYSGPIERDTMFFADMGFASIDAVLLGEQMESTFNRRFPFNELLMELQAEGVEDMPIGRLSAFVYQDLSSSQ